VVVLGVNKGSDLNRICFVFSVSLLPSEKKSSHVDARRGSFA
jgi:hypothetical protein